MSLHHPIVAIVGATGAVGGELIGCLESRNFPLERLRLLASARSAGRKLLFRGEGIAGGGTERGQFPRRRYRAVLGRRHACRGGSRRSRCGRARWWSTTPRRSAWNPACRWWCPRSTRTRSRATSASSPTRTAWRSSPWCRCGRCTGTRRIRRVIAATYQAASGAGAAAMEELRASTAAYLQGAAYQHRVLAHPYAFNLFSHDTGWIPATGYNEEETKVMRELRKIMDEPDLRIGVTCVRVPVLRAHRIALTVEFERPIAPERRATCSPPRRECASSTTSRAITSRCRSRRRDRTMCWWGASGGTSAIRRAVLWRCSWPAISC